MSQASVTFQGNPLALEGNVPQVGDAAPGAELMNSGLGKIDLEEFNGKVRVILTVPSLDTPVCDLETRRFNSEISSLGNDVSLIAVSTDLPFAQSRWCTAAAADNVTALSDHYDTSFGKAYGVLISSLRLLARAVFVVGPDDKISYVELVKEISEHPDYDAALNAVKALISE